MKKGCILFRILLSVCLFFFLFFSSTYALKNIKKNNYKEFLTPKKESWTGIIDIWHIVGFKPFQGSLTTYLQEIAQTYEKKHPGVYINVAGMEWSDALQKIQRGETPDIWSFPTGQLYAEQLAVLENDIILSNHIDNRFCNLGIDHDLYAIPYSYSGYFVVRNTQLTQDNALQLEDLNNLQQCLDMTNNQIACDSILVAAQLGLTAQLMPVDAFKSGKVAFAIIDARTLGDLCRNQNLEFLFEVVYVIPYTDQMQYISVSSSISDAKKSYAFEYIGSIFSGKNQCDLINLGLFPVIQLTESPVYSNDHIKKAKEILDHPQTINTFIYYSVKDKLEELAASALAGNATSKQEFTDRWSEVINK